jgi:hypothetical protein
MSRPTVFTCTAKNAFNREYTFAVLGTTERDAKHDLYTVAAKVLFLRLGQFRIHNVTPTNRRALHGMEPVKGFVSSGEQWAWMKFPS